jgi:cell division protein FtsZ
VPLAHPAIPPAADPAARPRARGPSLIERVTGVGRGRVAAPTEAPPAPQAAPVAPVAAPRQPPAIPPAAQPRQNQPRLAPLDPEERGAGSKEDDLLDIPAFLRRQAN